MESAENKKATCEQVAPCLKVYFPFYRKCHDCSHSPEWIVRHQQIVYRVEEFIP